MQIIPRSTRCKRLTISLYRILGELDAAAQAFVDADLQTLAKQVEDESDLNLSQLDFLESDVVTDDKD